MHNFEESLRTGRGYLLVAANSARMLAQAAHALGYKVLVIDCYGDFDTRVYSEDGLQIAGFNLSHLQAALTYFLDRYPLAGAVYGSGFERHPEALSYLYSKVRVFGNNPAVFNRLQDKPEFFSILSEMNIPYPEVSFAKPDNRGDWLVKPMRSQGGLGIRHYRPGESVEWGHYWQRYLKGVVHSVLFLANGNHFQTIGFNRQWQAAVNNREEFIFAGIINHTDLSGTQKSLVKGWVAGLVPEYKLMGLNSLDFIVSGNGLYVLEINPRPVASMQLFDPSLLACHITACEGELTLLPARGESYCAYQVIFAKDGIKVPGNFAWPGYAMDLPRGGSIINPGRPICSMIMRGKEPEAVMAGLNQQAQTLYEQLTGQSHGL